MDNVISKILDENKQLLSLPQTLAEVLRVVHDEKSSAQDLANVLLRDPALTARILRIVNSPFYGAGRKVSSVHQAVVTLGRRQVTAVALSSSIYDLTNSWKSGIDRMRFWRHSLEVAIAAGLIAELIDYRDREEAFISGLLHDIGILILEKSFPQDFASVCSTGDSVDSLIDLEEQTWGTNHAKVGQFLLEQWNLPPEICTAVGHHHDQFVQSTSNPDMALSQTVCLGNLLSQFGVFPNKRRQLVFEIENRRIIQGNLNLSPDQLAETQGKLLSLVQEEAGYLEIEIGSMDELLTEANRLLLEQYLAVENLLQENRSLQQKVTHHNMNRVALDSLRNIAVTLNRHINNATAAILGRAQMVETAIEKGRFHDDGESLARSMKLVSSGIETMGSVLKDLTNLAYFESSGFPERSGDVDIESKIREQLEKIEVAERV
jgi:putative nucleotidyltransferase with HDIG domain